MATLEAALARLSQAVAAAAAREQLWLDRVRAGLVALLGFLDDEPTAGRLLVFVSASDRAPSDEYEQHVLGVLAGLLLDESPQASAVAGIEPQLTAELVAGAVFSAIRSRMRRTRGGPFVELAPSLMSFIVTPYLGQLDASRELTGRSPVAEQLPSQVSTSQSASSVHVSHRTSLVLRAIAHAPRSSNREIAAVAGLGDQGQTSHLLRRLERRGLIEKVPPRSGSRRENAWLLTSCGQRVIELLSLGRAVPDAEASARARHRDRAR